MTRRHLSNRPQNVKRREQYAGRIKNVLWRNARRRAINKGLVFEITEDDIIIPDVCPVFGIPIEVSAVGRTDGSPSLDRIRPERGYTKDNIVIVSWRANNIKKNASLWELEKLVEFYRRKMI